MQLKNISGESQVWVNTWVIDIGEITVAPNESFVCTDEVADFLLKNYPDIFETTSGAWNVTAAANIPDNAIVRGDGGAQGIQWSWVSIDDENNIVSPRGIKLDTTNVPTATPKGTIFWNNNEYTPNIISGLWPTIQVGQQTFMLVYNNTGSAVPAWKVLHAIGAYENGATWITFEYADPRDHRKVQGTLFVSSHDIPNNSFGLAIRFGKIKKDTSGLTGAQLWLKADGSGDLTETKPMFPNFALSLGGAIKVDPTDGEIFISITSSIEDTVQNFWNGTVRESFDFNVTSDGADIIGTLTTSNGHPDLTLQFSDGYSTLVATPWPTITLTAGTDINPQTNYIYIPKSTKVLTMSTAWWPAEEHARIAEVALQDAGNTQTYWALRNQNWNDKICDTNTFQGHLAILGQAVRKKIPATYLSWCKGSVDLQTWPSPDDIFVNVTAGKILQMNEQDFPAFDTETGDVMFIPNHNTTPYNIISNLNTITVDANGNSLTGNTFSVVLWGAGNKSWDPSQLFINLPIDSYDVGGFFGVPLSDAVADIRNYAVYDIPDQFQWVGFLIARFTFSLNGAGTGWTLEDTEDLTGRFPNVSAWGGAGGSGITAWLWLSDTPSSYSGQKGFIPQVNDTEVGLEFYNPYAVAINTQTWTTYTLVADDAGKLITLNNAGAITLTIPTNASVPFPIGTKIDLAQLGAGAVTVAGTGVTISSDWDNKTIDGQNVAVSLVKIATDTWLLVGKLTT